MAKGKNVFTTGDVARICNVAPRTVSKWFDNGKLKGYRIPGSKDRRIPINELLRFMRSHIIPTALLESSKIRVLIVDEDTSETSRLVDLLRKRADYEVESVHNTFDTGMIAQRFTPHVLLINLLAENLNATEICKSIRANEDLQTVKIIAIANELGDSESAALLQKGFDSYVSDPTDVTEVIREIEDTTAIIY